MNTPMTAPSGNFQQRQKRADVTLVPSNIHPAILYSIVDLGTQETNYQGKIEHSRKIKFTFEFPTHKQLFYEDDTEYKPSVLSLEFAFAMYVTKQGKKTKMLEFVESMIGRPLQKEEYGSFDISVLLGNLYTVTVVHYLKQDGNTGAKISAASPFNQNFFVNEINSGQLTRTNTVVLFSLNHGFESAAFASMGYFDRKALKASKEGIDHNQRGGKFVKFDDNGAIIYDDAPVAAPAAANTPQQHYQQAMAQPVAQPLQQGYQQQPMQQMPQQPAQPIAPPPAPPVATAPVSTFRFIPQADGATYEQLIAAGWNNDLLVQHGRGAYEVPQPVAPAPVPPAPVPQVPPMPQSPPPAVPQPIGQNLQPSLTMQQPPQQMPIANAANPAIAQPAAPPAQMFQQAPSTQPNEAIPQQMAPPVAPPNAGQPVQHATPAVPQAAPVAAPPQQQMTVFDGNINADQYNTDKHDDLPF